MCIHRKVIDRHLSPHRMGRVTMSQFRGVTREGFVVRASTGQWPAEGTRERAVVGRESECECTRASILKMLINIGLTAERDVCLRVALHHCLSCIAMLGQGACSQKTGFFPGMSLSYFLLSLCLIFFLFLRLQMRGPS